MADGKYNGWTNYETWNVALWLDNEQGTYEMFTERARERFNDVYDSLPDEMTVGDKITQARDGAVSDLADDIESFVTDPEELGCPMPANGIYSDLLTHALGMVYWREIAEHYLSGVELTGDGK